MEVLVFFSIFYRIKTMWLAPINKKFGGGVHKLWSKNPSLDDPMVSQKWILLCNFEFSSIKLVMLDPQNTKNATSNHVFRAMFDHKGLDPFWVHNFGLFKFLIRVQNISFFPKN